MPSESDRPHTLGDFIHRVSRPLAQLQARLAPLSAFAERWDRIIGRDSGSQAIAPTQSSPPEGARPTAEAGASGPNPVPAGRRSSGRSEQPSAKQGRADAAGLDLNRDPIPAPEVPLSRGAQAVARVLCMARPAEAMSADEIVKAAAKLEQRQRYFLSEDVVRGRLFRELKPWGMLSHRRRGYFIPPSRREHLLRHLRDGPAGES